MPNLNMVQIMGNLTRDPELKYTPKATPICGFGMAINRNYTTGDGEKREEVTFLDVEFWGKSAETIAQYIKKGDPLYVQGRLKLDQWDDKTTGQKRSKLSVIGEQFQFLKSKGDGTPRHSEEADQAASRDKRPVSGKRPDPSDAPLDADDGDDVPF